jgi:hypothetical protein
VLVGPVEGNGAAALQNHDQWLAGRGQGFKQLLLGRGQVQAGAVAAVEAVDLDVHLFAFKLRGKSDESYHYISLLRLGDGFGKLGVGGRHPTEREPPAGLVAGVRVLEAELMRIGVGEIDRDGGNPVVCLLWRCGGRGSGRRVEIAHGRKIAALAQAAFGEHLAVEDEAVGLDRRVRKAVSGFESKDIVARSRDG